jgi:hypothetical protein
VETLLGTNPRCELRGVTEKCLRESIVHLMKMRTKISIRRTYGDNRNDWWLERGMSKFGTLNKVLSLGHASS